MTDQPNALVRFRRAIEREDALHLVHLFAEKESPKYEAAARRWLRRYLEEQSPSLLDFAQIAASLAQHDHR